jgi:endonuclease/exonuclease/phosphatase family metal-dependent hydrolase
VRILTWNLFHGRSLPPSRHELLGPFAATLAGWHWDVALLQEVPPWWPPILARETGAEAATALTSRNAGLPLRRALARRAPELVRSSGGGANAILSRIGLSSPAARRLRHWPERRVAQAVRLPGGATAVNLHASTRRALALQEVAAAWRLGLELGEDGAPLILGGDLNLWHPPLLPLGEPIVHAAASAVDHVYAVRAAVTGAPQRPDATASVRGRHVRLSDHHPLLVTLRTSPATRTSSPGCS